MRGLVFALVRIAARIVPAPRREAWLREWTAELHHALDRLDRDDGGGPGRLRLLVRAAASFPDALWLRAEGVRPRDAAARVWQSLRSLGRTPELSVPVVLTLAVGIGACTALFSVAHAVLLRPLPFPEPGRLTLIRAEARATGSGRLPVDAPVVPLIRERVSAFQEVAFVRTVSDGALTGTGDARSVALARVTTNFFDVLGVDAALGRAFRSGDGHLTPGEADRDDDDLSPLPPTVVLLSDELWRGRFGGDPTVLGRTVGLDGTPAVVVGVMPPGFRMPMPPGSGVPARVDAWTPVRFDLALLRRTGRLEDQDSRDGGIVVARRRAGVPPDEAARALDELSGELRAGDAAYRDADLRLVAGGLREEVGRRARPTLLALLGAAGLALLVACLDVAGLLHARALERERGRAVRAAMGASRARLVGDAVLEVGLLAGLGGAAGVGLAALATPALLTAVPAAVPRLEEVGVNPWVLGFALLLTLLVAFLSGVLPALRASRVDARTALAGRRSTGTTGSGGPGPGAGAAVVAGQLALVTALVVGAFLLARTVRNLQAANPGFRPDAVLAFDLGLVYRDGYRGPGDRARFLAALRERLGTLPGVEAVGATGGLPLSDRRFTQPYALPGEGPLGTRTGQEADFRVVTRGYFRAVGTRILSGRTFVPGDDDQDRRVAIVDEALAGRITASSEAAPGAFLRIPVDGEEVRAQVVGVVERVRFEDLRRDGRPAVYVPYRHEASRRVSVLVRVRGGSPPTELLPRIRAVVEELDPRLAIHRARTMEQLVSASLAPSRFLLTLFSAFGALALILAAIGVFGVVAHGVRARRHEIGVRAAMGASRTRILRDTLARSLALGGTGAAGGIVLALLASRLLRAVLYGVDPADPGALALAATAILATTLAAAWIPARRATRTDPMEVLRNE